MLAPAGAPASAQGQGFRVAPLTIDIYAAPEFAPDARYLEAALRTAGTALPIPPRLQRLSARPRHLSADWTFWLANDSLPLDWKSGLRQNARQLWLSATGPGVPDTSQLATNEPGATAATVFRRDHNTPAVMAEPVWADAQGRAILARQALGRGYLYRLHTRLNPAWSELADDPQLPARLLALLQPESDGDNSPTTGLVSQLEAIHERRTLAPAQLPVPQVARPAAAAPSHPKPPVILQTDLRPWLVLLTGLLLLAERLWSARKDSATTQVSG